MEEVIEKLVKQREQMLRLRNDSSLLQGITIRTLAGDIRIDKAETALMLLDHIIDDIQKQINYQLRA